MNTSQQKRLSSQISNLLKSKNLFEETDELLIDELIYQQFLITESKKSIKKDGIMINVRSEEYPLLQVNQAVSIYKDAVKTMITLCTKLGITPQERSKLKLVDKKQDFDLNRFLNDN